jgi:hypothetical protein
VQLLTIRRGMHGRCVLLTKPTEPEPHGTHLCFTREDGARLFFVDGRVRSRKLRIYLASECG